jgi:hypothetical protein
MKTTTLSPLSVALAIWGSAFLVSLVVGAAPAPMGGTQRLAGSDSAPAGLSAADWTGIVQQMNPPAQQAYLKASNTGANDHIGYAVSVSGDTLVAGAYRESSNATGVNGNQNDDSAANSGAAYVFVRDGTNWSQQAYLKASNAEAGDTFGGVVAVSGDTVVVGATSESSSATGVNGNQSDNSARNSGAAYVFVRNGTNWSQQAYLKAFNLGGDIVFGVSVAVSGDTIVVGAVRESSNARGVNGDWTTNSAQYSGAAYVFVRSGTNWNPQAYLKASNADAFDSFGRSVAVSGDTMVVGASGESSNATEVNGDQDDNSAYGAGAAYVFVRTGTNWTQQAFLKASNAQGGSLVYGPPTQGFGYAVAASGETVVVAAPGESSSATGVNGNQTDHSATNSGAAYVFVRHGTNWSQQAYVKASNTGAGDRFGYSVAVSGDTALIGAYQEDSNATGVGGDQANNNAADAGAAYIFVRRGTNWSQQAYLKASNTEAGDGFGHWVSVSGGTVAAGAHYESSNATGVNGNQSDNSAYHAGAGPQIAFAPDSSGGDFIRFAGHAGFTYQLERAPSVTGPWANIATNVAPPSGLVEFHDTNAPPGQAFYRVVQP